MIKSPVIMVLAAFATVLVIVLALVFLLKKIITKPKLHKVKGDELAVWPFSAVPIMTDTEVIFFKRLQQAFPEYLIFGQVQLSRIIAPDENETDKSFWFNRICRMSVDYIIVDGDCQTTLLAIELDDWTHDSHRRQQADAKKDKALSSAGIAILRVNAAKMPRTEQLRKKILPLLI